MEDLLSRLQLLTIQFPPFMIALVFHEVAHAWVANRWGDSTAKDEGRLSFNPMPHTDVMGTLVLPISMMALGSPVLFGWAKPVAIRPERFRNFRAGLFTTAAAGPGMNIVLALVSAMALGAMVAFVSSEFYLYEPLLAMLQGSIVVNFSLAFFNLLPLPPLDGSKMVQSFLSGEAAEKYESIAQYSFFIFMALIFTGALSFLRVPILGATQFALSLARQVFGI
jgi:Zn-dependent protease